MQLIKKMFGRTQGSGVSADSAQFHESDDATAGSGSRNAPRRELVHVVLRDSMRHHGIPSDWIDCRIMSVVSRHQKTGIHVQLIVRDGVDRLLSYVPAFQRSFVEELTRVDPRLDDWLFSLSWQFQNLGSAVTATLPEPGGWEAPGALAPLAEASGTRAASASAVQPPIVVLKAAAAIAPSPLRTAEPATEDQDVLDDLQALYAIRDAAMSRPASIGPAGEKDFESTHPGADGGHPAQR